MTSHGYWEGVPGFNGAGPLLSLQMTLCSYSVPSVSTLFRQYTIPISRTSYPNSGKTVNVLGLKQQVEIRTLSPRASLGSLFRVGAGGSYLLGNSCSTVDDNAPLSRDPKGDVISFVWAVASATRQAEERCRVPERPGGREVTSFRRRGFLATASCLRF